MHRSAPRGRRYPKSAGVVISPAGWLLLAMACLFLPAAIDAQEPESVPGRAPLHGVVYDALTGAAVPGAAVYLEHESYGVLADSLGTFRFEDVGVGFQVVAAIQFGYEEAGARIEVPEAGAFIEIELVPQPVLLDGVTAVVENITTMERRLRSRRRAAAYQTRAFDQERLLRSASSTALEFLERETRYYPVPCPAGAGVFGVGSPMSGNMSSRCIIRRGRVVSPRVFIDEIPAFGGLDELDTYPTAQIYTLEVYSSGAEVRAYTYNFMQRMARRPVALIPINLWP